jgi:hypothetical protein
MIEPLENGQFRVTAPGFDVTVPTREGAENLHRSLEPRGGRARARAQRQRAKQRRLYKKENITRAQRVNELLGYPKTQGDGEQAVIDLLADIRHWCDEEHAPFAELNRIAHMHYTAEVVQARTGA